MSYDFTEYQDYEIDNLEHIEGISCYNHNYYKGLTRKGRAVQDLLLGISDDDTETDIEGYYDFFIEFPEDERCWSLEIIPRPTQLFEYEPEDFEVVEDDFKSVIRVDFVRKSRCAGEEIYGEYSEEVELLRAFRDEVLSQTPEGQEIIRLYYQWSPVIVKAMKEDEELKEEVKGMIDGVLPLIAGGIE